MRSRRRENLVYGFTSICVVLFTVFAVLKINGNDSEEGGNDGSNNSVESMPVVETRAFDPDEQTIVTQYGSSDDRTELMPLISDDTPPSIYGTHNMEVFIDDEIPYLEGVIVTDDRDSSPTLIVDSSSVDAGNEGVYPVTYTASDIYGNTTSLTVNVIVRARPEFFYDPEVLYVFATGLNDMYGIYSDGMTDEQKAFRIIRWVHTNFLFSGESDRSDWTVAAYDAFAGMRGDSYGFAAVCKTFLNMEGIDSVIVERYPDTWSDHMWNLVELNGVWYHCDALAFSEPHGYCFMYSDDDIDSYEHLYDKSLYSSYNIAQDSVQQYVNYDTLEVDPF